MWGCNKNFKLAETYFNKGFGSIPCLYMLGVMNYYGIASRSSKKNASSYIKLTYELTGFTNLDREFTSKARDFWNEHELWKFSNEN